MTKEMDKNHYTTSFALFCTSQLD